MTPCHSIAYRIRCDRPAVGESSESQGLLQAAAGSGFIGFSAFQSPSSTTTSPLGLQPGSKVGASAVSGEGIGGKATRGSGVGGKGRGIGVKAAGGYGGSGASSQVRGVLVRRDDWASRAHVVFRILSYCRGGASGLLNGVFYEYCLCTPLAVIGV